MLIEKEFFVIVVCNDDEMLVYLIIEMVFNNEGNILDFFVVFGWVEKDVEKEVEEIVIRVVEVFDGCGVFGVEMFFVRDGRVFVNEIVLRFYNLGYWMIEVVVLS